MSSAPDLTARARIREAAITLIAERGVDSATIREIAQAAGVSSGLLRHHFGSKEGLRDACDDYVVAELSRIRAPLIENARVDDTYLLDALNAIPLRLQNYLVRSTMDGTPTGMALYLRMVDEGEHWIDRNGLKASDPRAFSAVLAAMKLGMFVLREQISQAIGDDTGRPAGQARMLQASVEIFSQPLVGPELAEQITAALEKLANQEMPA